MRPSSSFNSLSSRRGDIGFRASETEVAIDADANMKSLFTKSSSPHSSPADTSVTRRNVFLGIVALIVVAFFVFPSIVGSSDSEDGSPLVSAL